MGDGSQPADGLADIVGKIWARVIAQVNKLTAAHDQFGFVKFQESLNPSLPEVLRGFEIIEFALTQFVDSGLLEYDEMRNAINSKQCILKMKLLAAALDVDDQDAYGRIMADLQSQSKF